MRKKLNTSDEVVSSVLTGFMKRDSKAKKNKSEENSDNARVSVWRSYLVTILKYKFAIITLTVLFIACLCTYFYTENLKTSTIKLSLNYEEASEGLNPNGTPFDIYNILSDEVLQKAIDYAGYTGVVTPEQLADNIYLSQTTTSGNSDYYIGTSYRITYEQLKEIKDIGPKNMLSLISKAYKDYFFENYTINHTVLNISFDNFSDLEYDEIQRKFSDNASRISRFLQMRVDEGRNFEDSDGNTFKSLKSQVDNLVNYNISDLDSYIWEKGVLKNADEFVQTMDYRNYIDNRSYKTYQIGYSERKAGIDKYNSLMTASVLVPTYDKNGKFYMSRTKNGVDYLADEASAKEALATEINLKINTNKDKISKAKQANANQANIKVTENMIKVIESKMTRLVETIKRSDLEYKTYKTKNYLTMQSTTVSAKEMLGLFSAVELGFIFAIVLIFILRKSEKFRKAKK